MIALIPVRTSSRRCPGKNVRLLQGVPLFEYTIAAANASGVFTHVYVCTDHKRLIETRHTVGARYGVIARERVPDDQCDIVWIREALAVLVDRPDNFAILRPTSPFRTAATIQRAKKVFDAMADCGDSIRAVEVVQQTPFKMWTWLGRGYPLTPLLDRKQADGTPYHSSPTQVCPEVWIQNSSLEMAWTANVEVHRTIHGRKVGPFFTEGHEGFSIDTEEDFARAAQIARAHPERLPRIEAHVR